MDEQMKLKTESDKNDWISALSHEFRTPLNMILTTLQVVQLSEGSNGENDYKLVKNKHLKLMKQNCFRLLKMINNIIDISRINSDFFKIDLSNEDIVSIIENITLSVSDYCESQQISLVFDTNVEEHFIACDSFQLERIILNLLSNAIKFTPSGGCITVNLNVQDDLVFVSVKDTGIGIQEEFISSIFERFGQTNGKTITEKKGSGMGLFLVKKLLERMNGGINVKSKQGEGSIFTFFIPNINLPLNIKEQESNYLSQKIENLQIEFSDIYL